MNKVKKFNKNEVITMKSERDRAKKMNTEIYLGSSPIVLVMGKSSFNSSIPNGVEILIAIENSCS